MMSTLSQQRTKLNQQFDAAFNHKQADAIGELYVEHAVVIPASAGASVHGRAAITHFFKRLMGIGVTGHQLKINGLVECDTQAIQYGTWAASLIVEDGIAQHFCGNVQPVFVRQADSTCLTVTHLWN